MAWPVGEDTPDKDNVARIDGMPDTLIDAFSDNFIYTVNAAGRLAMDKHGANKKIEPV